MRSSAAWRATAWASPRATTDLDVAVVVPPALYAPLRARLEAAGLTVRRTITADATAPPAQKAYGGGEIVTHNLHNLYTLRGAKVRDALKWGGYIDEALRLFPDPEVEASAPPALLLRATWLGGARRRNSRSSSAVPSC